MLTTSYKEQVEQLIKDKKTATALQVIAEGIDRILDRIDGLDSSLATQNRNTNTEIKVLEKKIDDNSVNNETYGAGPYELYKLNTEKGMSYSKIAKLYGMPKSTVQYRISIVKKELNKKNIEEMTAKELKEEAIKASRALKEYKAKLQEMGELPFK